MKKLNPEFPSFPTPNGEGQWRVSIYWLAGPGLALGLFSLHGQIWRGGVHPHTLMETMATVLAMTVGVMALVRFYSKKDTPTFLLGTGFLGTALLDGFHAVATSEYFGPLMSSDFSSLLSWSGVASRQFLSVMIFLSLLAWAWEKNSGRSFLVREKPLYLTVAAFTIGCFLFFAFAPLPPVYSPDTLFHRPGEFGPALFFLLALAGYLRKGKWRYDPFEHWLVLSLIAGFIITE